MQIKLFKEKSLVVCEHTLIFLFNSGIEGVQRAESGDFSSRAELLKGKPLNPNEVLFPPPPLIIMKENALPQGQSK